jgi:hypothetical protein
MVPPVSKSSRGFVQCASFRQPQSPARRADGLLSDDRGLGLAERTLSFVRHVNTPYSAIRGRMTLKPAEIGPKRASLEYIFAAALDAPPLLNQHGSRVMAQNAYDTKRSKRYYRCLIISPSHLQSPLDPSAQVRPSTQVTPVKLV